MIKQWIIYKDLQQYMDDSPIVIFGAGHYGQMLCVRLLEDFRLDKIIFCDNDINKWNKEIFRCPIYSVEYVVDKYKNAKYIIIGNVKRDNYKIESMYKQIKKDINYHNIIVISSESLQTVSDEKAFTNAVSYVDKRIKNKKNREIIIQVEEVKTITYRNKLIGGAGGGPAKVIEIQEKLLGNRFGNVQLTYLHKKENQISLNSNIMFSNSLGAIEFAIANSADDKNVAYIAHDIFSAFGLAMNGKRYALVYHSQGETVYEWNNMGENLSIEQEKFIKKIERISIENAYCVSFPSQGAEYFYWKSWGVDTVPNYNHGEVLYNTVLNDDLIKKETVGGLKDERDSITFLSIGQMTSAKGMDRIPSFLNELSKLIDKKIRWIVVADGKLKNHVLREVSELMNKNSKVEVIQFDSLNHQQINYLYSISNIYLMLHRISIFDLATLEAMCNNLTIVLSDVPGNTEYNLDNNIVLISDLHDIYNVGRDILLKEKKNRKIFEQYFSEENFKIRYEKLIEKLLVSMYE